MVIKNHHFQFLLFDRVVFVNCSFGTTNKYVNSDSFKRAKIKNKFASCNVYFDNAFIAGKSADIYVNNSFGETTLHFPSDWKLNVKKRLILMIIF